MSLATVNDFPWAGDIGTSSIDGLTQLTRSSGISFQVSSAYRSTSTTYHGTHNAIDIVSSTASMEEIAKYLKTYSTYLLELIHSGGAGYYVKNGKVVNADFYSAEIAGHKDHVHLASTLSALAAASNHDSAKDSLGNASSSIGKGSGCAAVIVGSVGLISLLSGLAHHLLG